MHCFSTIVEFSMHSQSFNVGPVHEVQDASQALQEDTPSQYHPESQAHTPFAKVA